MLREHFFKRSEGDIPEGPIEAGQTLGMTPQEVLKKYFNKRNDLLKLLRVYSGLSIADVAEKLDISDAELEEIENSDKLAPFQLIPRFAKIFNVDLKIMLILLGHTKGEVSDDKAGELKFGLAAQYSGPELTKQEKIDLEELFKTIVEHIKTTKSQQSK
jgi:transcriptional regulator with XRE-family HTH domain